jgi:hypothetical protein
MGRTLSLLPGRSFISSSNGAKRGEAEIKKAAYVSYAYEITLTPIESKRNSPRIFHAGRITVQGVLIEIVRRSARRNW